MPSSEDIQHSLYGRKFGLDRFGRTIVNPTGAAAYPCGYTLYANTAASTALSNFTSQRAFDTYATIPANTLAAGAVIRIRYQGIQTAVNGTDTMQPILTIGGTLAASTLAVTSGTALLTATATAGAANLVFHGEYELIIRTIGSSGTMVGTGVYKKVPAAEATYSAVDDILASTTIDTTVDQIISVGLAYGAASSSNSTRLDFLRVLIG
jgi:hypothetical protein